jgi:hypothetical protein
MFVANANLSRDYLTGKNAMVLDESVHGSRQNGGFPV